MGGRRTCKVVVHISESSSRQLINGDEILPGEKRERRGGDGNRDAPEVRDVSVEYMIKLSSASVLDSKLKIGTHGTEIPKLFTWSQYRSTDGRRGGSLSRQEGQRKENDRKNRKSKIKVNNDSSRLRERRFRVQKDAPFDEGVARVAQVVESIRNKIFGTRKHSEISQRLESDWSMLTFQRRDRATRGHLLRDPIHLPNKPEKS